MLYLSLHGCGQDVFFYVMLCLQGNKYHIPPRWKSCDFSFHWNELYCMPYKAQYAFHILWKKLLVTYTLYHFVTTKLGPNFIFQPPIITPLYNSLKRYLLKHEVLFSTCMNLKISNNGVRTQLHLHRFFHSISGYHAGLQIFHRCVRFLCFPRLFCGLGSVGV